MKKVYTKPLIFVEAMMLDRSIASNCTVAKDDMELLMAFGYFNSDRSCRMYIGTGNPGEGGAIDWDKNGTWDDKHDTVCYHSNIQVAFLS